MAYKKSNANGQATMANSEPVVIASNQSAIPVTDNSGSLTVDNNGTFAVQSTNQANSGVDIGDVTINNAAGASAVNIQDGGNSITVDGTVGVSGTVTVTATDLDVQSGGADLATSAQASAIQTAVQLIDDTVQVLGTDTYTEATSKGITIGAVRRDADTTLVNTTNEFGPLQMDANGRLKVEVFSGETLPVSGTVTANLAAGTNNIGDVDILSIAAGDNNIGNVDVVTLPSIPAGTNNIGDVDVLSIVPGTAATNLGKAVDSASGSTDTGVANLSVVDAALTAITPIDGDYAPTRVDANGALHMNMSYKLDSTNDSISIIPTSTATGIGKLEDAAHASGDLGVMALAVRRDTSAASSGTTGDYEPLSTDATGKLWIAGDVVEDVAHAAGETLLGNGVRRIDTPASSAGSSGDWATLDASAEGALWTATAATTTGGTTIFKTLDLDETEEDVKTSAGNLYGYYFYNAASSVRYLKVYNATAANVTVGTTTPVLTFPLPAGSAGHVAFPFPIGFSTAICVAATTGLADNDTGAPAANDVIFMAYYK